MNQKGATKELLLAVRKGDAEARKELIEQNLPLVWSIVNRFRHTSVEKTDLFQIGCVGLIKSIERFDTSYDVAFSTYAVPIILSEIKKFFRDEGAISVSRGLKELHKKINNMRDQLISSLEREPRIDEISVALGVSSSDVLMAIEANYYPTSLSEPIYEKDGSEINLEEIVTAEEFPSKVDLTTLKEAIEQLDNQEKLIIRLRYFENWNQSEVAVRLGVSQVQISRLEKKIIEKMRSQFV